MNDYLPPSYEETVAASRSDPSAPYIKEEYVPEKVTSKPPTAPPMETLTLEREPFIHFGALTDTELRDACYEYISDECCYGSRFIKDMTLLEINNTYSFHYKLESFGEKRETKWSSTAYYGQSIDGPENGPVPDPWDIRVQSLVNFKVGRTSVEIPHTSSVERCSRCFGDGIVRCFNCYGDGYNKCTRCDGRGRNSEDGMCISCNGNGRKGCSSCNGRGRVKCSICDGTGKVKQYKELIVTWANHVDNFITGSMKLSNNLIQKVSSRQILCEQDTQVFPISHLPNPKVNEASSQLLQKHATSFRQELILAQRHTVWAVPLTRARYQWKDWQDEFYVYGFEKKVHFEHYPEQGCCCICC